MLVRLKFLTGVSCPPWCIRACLVTQVAHRDTSHTQFVCQRRHLGGLLTPVLILWRQKSWKGLGNHHPFAFHFLSFLTPSAFMLGGSANISQLSPTLWGCSRPKIWQVYCWCFFFPSQLQTASLISCLVIMSNCWVFFNFERYWFRVLF